MTVAILKKFFFKGAPHTQDMDFLEQTGLAAAIIAGDQIDARHRAHVDLVQVSQAKKCQTVKRHGDA